MRSEVVLVACANRLPRIECRGGGVQARCTAPGTVHLVSAAATPLGGDTITIRVVVEPGATLALRSAAAAVALPGADSSTSLAHWEIQIAGNLDVDLEPTIVAASARHLSTVAVALHGAGAVRFRERVQIGRCRERDGFWSGSLRADYDDRPLLRHRVELGAGSLADDSIAAPRAAINEFRYPATTAAVADDDGWTVLALAGGGTLSTWQADRLKA
ncbi:urease accessory protein ureD [Mycobacterium bohemicum DSM 44277]|uniref:Urease accessory protein UreD n=2 Tax=Mycobacterium bohemicum TaxID=56425 RepID=A0A1X1QZR5_MYCBE|nr:urease accessory protein UreD [Mycobacterium bohemicum]MCV6971093.1 urease accessory protein UreD [Mycobacterium bohemicum]ORU96846.1 urease accessory protein UreD [Mycobacterium bohemicum]CPR06253.1 urease accessory protein ureD [Mycobacterium bohemicum DSM 44277]